MMLTIAVQGETPVLRGKESDEMLFYPDVILAPALSLQFEVKILNKNSYYMYLGKVTGHSFRVYHELMDDLGYVYKLHGRLFKNFSPAWEQAQ